MVLVLVLALALVQAKGRGLMLMLMVMMTLVLVLGFRVLHSVMLLIARVVTLVSVLLVPLVPFVLGTASVISPTRCPHQVFAKLGALATLFVVQVVVVAALVLPPARVVAIGHPMHPCGSVINTSRRIPARMPALDALMLRVTLLPLCAQLAILALMLVLVRTSLLLLVLRVGGAVAMVCRRSRPSKRVWKPTRWRSIG